MGREPFGSGVSEREGRVEAGVEPAGDAVAEAVAGVVGGAQSREGAGQEGPGSGEGLGGGQRLDDAGGAMAPSVPAGVFFGPPMAAPPKSIRTAQYPYSGV